MQIFYLCILNLISSYQSKVSLWNYGNFIDFVNDFDGFLHLINKFLEFFGTFGETNATMFIFTHHTIELTPRLVS